MARKIVIVEDNPADAKTMRFALASRDPTIEIVLLEDGARAVYFFSSARDNGDFLPCDLVLLDLNLPRVSGFEVLDFLKADPELKKLPVVVLSGSSSQQDIERCYAAGANSYVSKPTGIEEVLNMASSLVSFWFDYAQVPGSVRALRAKQTY